MGELSEGQGALVLLALAVHHQLLLAGGKHPTHLTIKLRRCWCPARTPFAAQFALS